VCIKDRRCSLEIYFEYRKYDFLKKLLKVDLIVLNALTSQKKNNFWGHPEGEGVEK